MTGAELAKMLYDYDVYDAYQYISNTRKNIGIALFCKELIVSLISKMGEDHQKWQNSIFSNLFEQTGTVRHIALTTADMPNYRVSVCDVEVTAPFLLDKLTKDFFQYIRNAFDCMSQAVNAACLASCAENIDQVDFGFMKKEFKKKKWLQAFPDIAAWYDKISCSNEFQYIEAFNNRTKHICDVYLKLSMAIMSGKNELSINPFYKKGNQHSKQDIAEYLTSVYDFMSESYSQLLSVVKAEIPAKRFVGTRLHKLKIYQQKLKNNAFSVAYIDAFSTIGGMPDEIEVLFLNCSNETIHAKNCPINTIYIKDPKVDFSYIGTYIAKDDSCGDDTLLRYRKYKKVPYNARELPLCVQAMTAPENKVLYHRNPFMDIETVSDDEEFSTRVRKKGWLTLTIRLGTL